MFEGTAVTDAVWLGHTSPRDSRESRYSQSLERGLAVLGCFTPEHPVLGITAIADKLGMSKSTTHRYASTLVALGYLEQGPASPKYRLGLRAADLGLSALNSMGLREHARPYLEELRRRSTYTVSMAILEKTEIRFLDRVRSVRSEQAKIDLDLRPGSTLPAYCTSMGKLLLAHLPQDEQRKRIDGIAGLTKRAPNTITSKSALRKELARVREAGLARAALDRRARARRGARSGRGDRHDRAHLDDLPGGARRRARPAAARHGRSHLRTPGLSARRREVVTLTHRATLSS
jgi:IclR family pca regulon transcriptional regulator